MPLSFSTLRYMVRPDAFHLMLQTCSRCKTSRQGLSQGLGRLEAGIQRLL
jgi:hypothetical protein